ncbi:MAG: hypothetical protein IPP51_02790 [Bacteroidetes bacterium]|nr:hypothetical protein [Bacteroidota bacterium]
MRKDIHRENVSVESIQHLKVVETERHPVQVELEIENHVHSIRALIQKLHPTERQKYFDGLLNHLLHQDVQYPFGNPMAVQRKKKETQDFSRLNGDDLELIRELSCKLQDLYAHSGDVVDN